MEINLLYVHADSLGYGRYGVYLARELQCMGVAVYDDLPGPRDPAMIPFTDNSRRSGICNVVAWISTPTHARGWYKGQMPVISTMWESMSLPWSFRENLDEFGVVIVPSPHNQELFGQYHPNVKLVPLGVDPEVWHFTPRKPPAQWFNFLIAGSGPRKGTDLAYKAFRKLFKTWPKEGPIPRLVMKSPRGEEYHGERVEIIGGRISAADEVAVYADAHCYLQPSRGEGFGLQPLQALAQGCPTILTNAHGHAAFAHLGYGLSTRNVESGYFLYGPAGDWWEPDFDELCERMEWVYHNYGAAQTAGKKAAAAVRAEHTWAHTAQAFVQAIGEEALSQPGPVPVEWVEPTPRRYLVITHRNWTCDIAGTHYQFRRGERYWELADVKRILFEAGLLDPACLVAVDEHGNATVDDLGLAPPQLAKLGAYTAAHGWCETCGQKLGSGEMRDEALV